MKQKFGGFFDRLNHAPPLRRRSNNDEFSFHKTNGIKRHIERLLNARKGSSLSAPDFGLNDFNDASIGTSDMVAVISEDIKATINRFDSRVTITDVQYDRDNDYPLELKFIISGFAIVDGLGQEIIFAVAMDRFSRQWRNA